MKPKIAIVNEQDEVIGAEEKHVALDNQLIRRLACIFLQDSKGNIFFQKRGPQMNPYPNTWTFSVSGHVDADEDYLQTAERELFEEVGLRGIPLKEVLYFFHQSARDGKTLRSWSKVYLASYMGQVMHLQQEEIAGGEWFTPQHIDMMIQENPEQFSNAFVDSWKRLSL